ncbi:hypothetical protein ACQEU3_44765 [Spirillospora sp. CA-253888]
MMSVVVELSVRDLVPEDLPSCSQARAAIDCQPPPKLKVRSGPQATRCFRR